MDPLRIAVRVLFAYVVLLVLLRLAGKRFVAQATGFDFVLALVVGDLVDDVFWAEVPAAQFVAAAGALVLAQVTAGLASVSYDAVSDLVGGRARLLVRAGSPLRPALRAERINLKELASMLRSRGLGSADWVRVRSGWIERGGGTGLLEQDWSRPVQRAERERVGRRR